VSAWDPAQYLRFAEPRLRPAIELLARVALDAPACVYDLGCGTGSASRLLAARWPGACVTGVDGSEQMLAAADAAGLSNLHWQQQDIALWRASPCADLIYSNAALHWLSAHERVFPQLLAQLAPDGVLAVQMPRNFSAPSHTAIGETVRSGPWRSRLEPLLTDSPVASPAWYFDLLSSHGAAVDLWETEYFHVLEGDDPVPRWTRGTWLAPLLAALPAHERAQFEREYAERVAAAYPCRVDGTTVLPFRRLFFVARRLS
jgi:trans-aconitate 2-methyltransferase